MLWLLCNVDVYVLLFFKDEQVNRDDHKLRAWLPKLTAQNTDVVSLTSYSG